MLPLLKGQGVGKGAGAETSLWCRSRRHDFGDQERRGRSLEKIGGRGVLGGRESRGSWSVARAAHVPARRKWDDEQETEGSGQVGGGKSPPPPRGSWDLSLGCYLEKVGVEKRRRGLTHRQPGSHRGGED